MLSTCSDNRGPAVRTRTPTHISEQSSVESRGATANQWIVDYGQETCFNADTGQRQQSQTAEEACPL